MSYFETKTGRQICTTCNDDWRTCNCHTCPNCEGDNLEESEECVHCGYEFDETITGN